VAINTTNIVGMTLLKTIAPIAKPHISPRLPKYLKKQSPHHRRSGPQTYNNKEPPQQKDYPIIITKRPGGA
jgi:hypothetical protein